MFIKRGDGKILSVVETDDLTEEQKKSAEAVALEIKTSDKLTETKNKKVSGSN